MNRKYAFLLAFALVGGLVVACGGGMAEEPVAEGGGDASGGAMYSAEAGPGMVPMFEVDPTWPNNLPNHWLMGPTIGVDVDARDNIWIVHRNTPDNFVATTEIGLVQDPPLSLIHISEPTRPY